MGQPTQWEDKGGLDPTQPYDHMLALPSLSQISEKVTSSLIQLSTNIHNSEPNECTPSSLNHLTQPKVSTHVHEPMGCAQPVLWLSLIQKIPLNPEIEGGMTT